MRGLFGFLCICALVLSMTLLAGCGDPAPCEGVICDDKNACTEDACNRKTGVCQFKPVMCRDDNECTVDSCDPDDGCRYDSVDDGSACDEGNECTVGECSNGACVSNPVPDGSACDEGNECTVGECSNGTCDSKFVPDGTVCGEGDVGTCHTGVCVGPFACTRAGIRAAFAEGGGPFTIDCDGPTTVVTASEIVISKDVILDGGGNLTIDGNEHHRVLHLLPGVTATFDGLTITRGYIRDANGGGIDVGAGSVLTLNNSTVSDNTAELPDSSYLWRGIGGGIYSRGTVTLNDSTVSGNVSLGGWHEDGFCFSPPCGRTFRGGKGGAIYNEEGTVTLNNSTVSGNWAEHSAGAIYNEEGTVTLNNSTVSANTDQIGVDIWSVSGRAVTVTNTLLDVESCYGTIDSGGHNIESPGDTCGFDPDGTDQVSVSADDLNLRELADNGGPTETHALLPGSVAIDVIPEAECVDADSQALTTDQRGEPRPAGAEPKCDVGSFEVQPVP